MRLNRMISIHSTRFLLKQSRWLRRRYNPSLRSVNFHLIDVYYWQIFCALSEWRNGVHAPTRFDGEVYKHLYQRFMDYMEKIKQTRGTSGRRALGELQKHIAKDGMYVLWSWPFWFLFLIDTTIMMIGKRGTRMLKRSITWCSIDNAVLAGRIKQCW